MLEPALRQNERKMNMKTVITLTAIGGFLALGAAQSIAQSTNTFVTNSVQALNIALTGLAQNSSNTNGNSMSVHSVRITTRDVINDLGTATGTKFTGRARLLLVAPPEGGNSVIVVRDGTGRAVTDTDVSSFFSNQAVGAPVERSTTSGNGATSGVQYSTQNYSFGSGATTISFNLEGFTTTTLSNQAFTSTVLGPGTVNGENAVLKGMISASPARLERILQP